MEERNIKRIRRCRWVFCFLMVLLAARLFFLQISSHDELASAAVSQYEIPVIGFDTRGRILDRNYMPLTGGTYQYYYVISRQYESGQLDSMMESIDARQIAADGSAYLVYRTETFDHKLNDRLKSGYEAYVFRDQARYSREQTACHLIGYINKDQGTGVSGLELMYEDRLRAGSARLTIWADAAGNILRGISPSVNEEYGTQQIMEERSLVTTIDRRIQHVCEEALSEHTSSGAALVMECETGQILAWASVPVFDPNHVEDYLEEESDRLVNKVSQAAYAPGSVFKIVTAAAALESGKCDETKEFTCTGHVTVNGVTMTCMAAQEEGHGTLDMNRAMAVSCNCYFAQLGGLIGEDAILEMADSMGFGSKVLDGFPEESSGNIPDETGAGPWDVSNIAIGQGQILATPLQVAQMTSIIAGKGISVSPSVISEQETNIADKDDGQRILDEEVAGKLEKMMSLVMTEGTGAGDWDMPVWGKTGTAQAGSVDGEVNNCWFTGYCRIGDKTYVITVMAEDGTSGAGTAMPVFGDIAGFLKRSQDAIS